MPIVKKIIDDHHGHLILGAPEMAARDRGLAGDPKGRDSDFTLAERGVSGRHSIRDAIPARGIREHEAPIS